MNDDIVMLTCGPADHGIVRFGRQLHEAAVALGFTGTGLHETDPLRLVRVVEALPPTVRIVHLQANDWLFSDPGQSAAHRITAFADALRARRISLTLTLHDLPHPHVSRELFHRRARTYLALMSRARAVVVSSNHERLLIGEAAKALRESGDLPDPTAAMPGITVIPLPVPASAPGPRAAPPDPWPTGPTIGVLGFVYPGKGHRDIIEELADFAPPITVLAVGGPSHRHEAMVPELADRSQELGLAFGCTGFVPEAGLADYLEAVTVPVAAAPHVSASASINTWIGAGRRPLVLASRYSRELHDRMPGSVLLYDQGQLRSRVQAVLAEPSSTRLPATFRPQPDVEEIAGRYLRWLGAAATPRFQTGGSGH